MQGKVSACDQPVFSSHGCLQRGSWPQVAAFLWLFGEVAAAHAQTTPGPRSGDFPSTLPAPKKPTETSFSLLGAPTQAEVFVDDTSLGITPLARRVPIAPGPHKIRISRRGYTTYTGDFVAYAERVVTIEVEMTAVTAPYKITVEPPDAQIFIDEELRADPPLDLDLQPGQHSLRARRKGYQEQQVTLTAVAGEPRETTITLEPSPEELVKQRSVASSGERPWYRKWWVWTLASVGAAGIATAIVVPTVLSQRSACEKIGAEVCFPVSQATPTLQLNLHF